jgi:hypothetical protein
MKIVNSYKSLGLLLMVVSFLSCEKKDRTIPKVSLSTPEVLFTVSGGSSEVTI